MRRTRSLAALMLVLAAATPAAMAGGSAEDYARAERLGREVRGKVLNERLRPTWLGPDRVFFRDQVTTASWRFRVADARGVRDAFDHDAVARALGELLAEEVAPDRLPLRTIVAVDGDVVFSAKKRIVAVDLEDSTVAERDARDVAALTLRPTSRRRSRDLRGGDTSVLFVNETGVDVEAIWLDRQGEERSYGTVAKGATREQHTLHGHLWLVRATDGTRFGVYEARRTPGVIVITPESTAKKRVEPTAKKDPSVSPDGRFRVIVRTRDVYMNEIASGAERRLTDDGAGDDGYVNRVMWAPDSRHVAVLREQPSERHDVHMVASSPKDRVEPKLVTHSYLKPGDQIRRQRPHVFRVESGERLPFDESLFQSPWSVGRFSWSADGRAFRFLYNQRGHQVLRLVELDVETRAARALIEEAPETFVDYSQKTYLRELPESGDWLWMTERSGWNHLVRVDGESGVARRLTEGAWVVRDVVHVDDAAGTLTFRAMGVNAGEDPYHIHCGRVPLDGGAITWLTDGDGTHALAFSADRSHYVDSYSRADAAPIHELRRASDGALVGTLAKADWGPLLATGWTPPVRFSAKGRDGVTDIWGLLNVPSTHNGAKSLPVVEAIYAGPHGQHVPKAFRPWTGPRSVAELGFAVVQIDGMGTNWRSKAFHDVCWKNLGDAGFPDRIRWIKALAKKHAYLDLERVGIYGGSAGGQNAMRGLLAHSEFYKVGVADCGCHDNRMDKIWWNEAWMGWPIGEHYAEQSNVTQAHRLQGKLLLIVGELDQNVDPASTMQVVDALIKADKDFDLLVMPGVGHGAAGTPYGARRLRDFLVRELLGVEPRWE